MANVKNVAPGVGLCAAIALPCWFLGEALPVVGGPVFAILIGMVIALWWKQPARGIVQDGIGFTAKKVLQYAVILLGFGLNLAQIAAGGRRESLPIILTTIATALIVGYILYRVLRMDSAHRHAHRRGLVHLRRLGHRRHGAGHPRQGRGGGPGHLGHLPVQRHRGAHLPYAGKCARHVQRGLRPVRRHRRERHLVGHRRRGRLGRHASRHRTPWTTPPS